MSQGAVTGVQRVLRIFESFSTQQSPMSLSELAERTGTPKSTCHAIINTLIMEGYLYTLRSPRVMYPTKRIWQVSQRINSGDPVAEWLLPLMEEVRDQIAETVILGKIQRDAVLYLEVAECRNAIRYTAEPGEFRQLHSSCSGKALLSALSSEDFRTVVKRLVLKRITPNTITTSAALKREMEEVRARGYATTSGENVADVSAVALPIKLGTEIFSVAVAGPTHRIDHRVSDISKALFKLRDAITI